MDQLSEFFQPVIDFVLGNIGIVVFAIFILSGLFGRGDKNKEQEGETAQAPERRPRPEGEVDNRPLSERLAEAFGVEIPEEQTQPRQQPQSQWPDPADRYGSEGRRSTVRRNVQDEYPNLFGGKSMFEEQEEAAEPTKWGFDETEWGTTFDKNDEQWGSDNRWGSEGNWGNTFPDRKSDEPYIDWPR